MKIKEKVLKEIMESERYKEFQDWLTAKWFSEKSIDLTLAERNKEVGKVIDGYLKDLKKYRKQEGLEMAIVKYDWGLSILEELKQKLEIK